MPGRLVDHAVGNQVRRNATRARIMREIDDSLRRLRTDRIDLYQVHWPDPVTPMEETIRAMEDLYRAGKIRAIGVPNFSSEQMKAFHQVAPMHSNQLPYNLFERDIERDPLPFCRERGVPAVTYGSICRGLLSGRVTGNRRFHGDDLRRIDPKFQQPRLDQYLAAVEALDTFARERFGKDVIALAVRWLLDQPGVTVALWGARRPDQLEPAASVEGWHVGNEAMRAMDDIIARYITDPVGPEFMAPPQ